MAHSEHDIIHIELLLLTKEAEMEQRTKELL